MDDVACRGTFMGVAAAAQPCKRALTPQPAVASFGLGRLEGTNITVIGVIWMCIFTLAWYQHTKSAKTCPPGALLIWLS